MDKNQPLCPPLSWITTNGLHIEPIASEPALASGNWRQDAAYPDPLWAKTAAELAQRISIENHRNLYALHLFSSSNDAHCTKLLEIAGWLERRTYHVGGIEAPDPIAAGYLRRYCLWHTRNAPTQPIDPINLVNEFCTVESARMGDVETWLVDRYGQKRRKGEIFDWIDYPAFDNGTMGLGFALLIHGPVVHIWSRCVHYHK